MAVEPSARADLRELGKAAIRAEVTQRAIALLDERGFDETTVEELAAAVGISPRSFFRYFSTKEDIVLGDLPTMGVLIEEALLARPDDESAWTSLRAALEPLVRIAEEDETRLRSSRVGLSTANLRAKNIERHTIWAATLSPIVARRLGDTHRHASMAAEALTQSALACLYVATLAWVASNGEDSYGELIDEAFKAVGRQ